jgi:hypothetical protein
MTERDMNLNPTGKGGFQERPQDINRSGRPSDSEADLLREAMIEVEEEKKEKFYKHCARRAFINDDMAKVILKKYIPDLQSTILSTPEEGIKIVIEDAKYENDK